MAEQTGTNNSTEREIVDSVVGDEEPAAPAPVERSYRIDLGTRLPVSKHLGKLWESRRDQAVSKRQRLGFDKAWNEAIMYYLHDQTSESDRDPRRSSAERDTRRMNDKFSETENIVFANVNALVPSTYAKNPEAEVTVYNDTDEGLVRLGQTVKRLLNVLANRKAAPGFNLKGDAKRAVVYASLTNAAFIEIGYTRREDSIEAAVADLNALADEYSKEGLEPAKIREIEGKLEVIEKKFAILQPAGPWVRFRDTSAVLIGEHEKDDLSDAPWIMVSEYVSTEALNAEFGGQKGKDGKVMSLYKPTHVLAGKPDSGDASHENMLAFSLFEKGEAFKEHGFSTPEQFQSAQMTKVWKVWDRVTRRAFLFADNDWSWPVWVWDDPLKLDRFFPVYRLSFYTNPLPGESRGEVSYYLDQQDAINEINDEERRARHWLRKNVFFDANSGISREDVEAVLSGPDGTVRGVSIPEGKTINDIIGTIVLPNMQSFPTLFDKSTKLQAIDRLAATSEIQRGAQFKTNTTNKAIEEYSSITATKLDERIDAVEDFIGDIMWGVAQLLLQFMSREEVEVILGADDAAHWVNLTPMEMVTRFSVRVVGGSSVKPTSKAKKEEALQIGQILGQFASASPMAVVVALRVFERAFDEITVQTEDWTLLRQSIAEQLGMNEPASAHSSPAEALNDGGGGELQQLAQMLDALPPEAKQALGMAIAQGMPIEEAVSRILQVAQQQGAGGGGMEQTGPTPGNGASAGPGAGMQPQSQPQAPVQ